MIILMMMFIIVLFVYYDFDLMMLLSIVHSLVLCI